MMLATRHYQVGQFLVKDILLLAASLLTAAESLQDARRR
jgi:uncharacterized membrane protein YkgB